MILQLSDNKGNKVEIEAEQIGLILEMLYMGVYEGGSRTEEFIDWFQCDCPGTEK